jgi:hypothetical protein
VYTLVTDVARHDDDAPARPSHLEALAACKALATSGDAQRRRKERITCKNNTRPVRSWASASNHLVRRRVQQKQKINKLPAVRIPL